MNLLLNTSDKEVNKELVYRCSRGVRRGGGVNIYVVLLRVNGRLPTPLALSFSLSYTIFLQLQYTCSLDTAVTAVSL